MKTDNLYFGNACKRVFRNILIFKGKENPIMYSSKKFKYKVNIITTVYLYTDRNHTTELTDTRNIWVNDLRVQNKLIRYICQNSGTCISQKKNEN